jgi:hypothetical protein
MKRYLLLIMMSVLVSIGTWAATISGTDISGGTAGYDPKVQTLVISQPGALAQWVADHTGDKYDTNNPFQGLGGSNDFYALAISGELNADDLAALNSTTCAAFSRFPRIDMSGVTLASGATKADVFAVNFGAASFQRNSETLSGDGATYIRLPNDMTSADDVKEMAKMKQSGKNANLKMVGAYDPDNSEFDDSSKKWAEVAMHSFEANKVPEFLSFMRMPTSGNPTVVPRDIKMSGEYGVNDLVNGGTPNFGYGTSAKWDFTGAHFADCTVAAATQDASYYNYDDPFCDGQLVKCPTTTNAFYYFSQYTTNVVDLKLPDNNMTHLPFRCISDLASDNVSGYKALYGETEFNNNKVEDKIVPIESLVIPDCYTDLDEECGKWARIRHLVVGSGMKRIHGGAFLKCDYLEDLDFAAGLADCYIGDRAFNECKSMKHIALSEGIVSLGYGCFTNSQHLESIRLPQSLRDMGNNCFDNCLALNSITIPENVEKIGKQAFRLCPFTDIYLTTTDPAKIPYVWSAGTKFTAFDGNCTFHHGHLDGWEGGVDGYKDDIDGVMTWDEAAPFYYMNWNGMPVLHFPSQLADKVRSSISSEYAMKTKADENGVQYGLPMRVDMDKRDNIPGADLGTSGTGKYTQDGWAQFMLMKEMAAGPGSEIYQKEYDDVWYTMCFPFDLSDEQLAAAFNETFNIVDFSGVEVVEADKNDGESMKLILHFNNVAVTDYKDTNDKHYKRKLNSDGSVIREIDETSKFSYNVYTDKDGQEYHHVTTSTQLSSNKTKSFAPGSSMADAQAAFNANHEVAVMIDGVLATAGHPYMIHPAIGVVAGQPKQRCTFAGIEWKGMTTWGKLFKENSRTIDLGVKKTLEELPDSNYNHPGYDGYAGQTYTFIGNPDEYQIEGAPEAPTVANGQLREYPTKPTKEAYPTEPVKEAYPEEPTLVVVPQPEISLADYEAQNKPAKVEDPGTPTANEQTLYSHLTEGQSEHNRGCWYGETLITASYNDGSEQYTKWNTINTYTYQNDPGINLYGGDEAKEASFNLCKASFNKCIQAEAYAQYLSDLDAYNAAYGELKEAWEAYNAYNPEQAQAEYDAAHSQWEQDCADIDGAYNTAHSQWEQDCADIDDAYDTAYSQWQSDCEAVDTYNDGVYAAWEVQVAGYKKQIPEHAYFLGRKTGQLPKYYREVAAEEYPAPSSRKGGLWSQFTAIVIPNTAAINGIEKGISKKQAGSKGFDMLFNEDFEGTFIDQDEATTLIEKAQAEGAEVKHIDIVVNINGQVVRRGTTSIEGLPKGIYIINGKKYFVK